MLDNNRNYLIAKIRMIILLGISITIYSCSSHSNQTKEQSYISYNQNPFMGKHQAKVMILGVFHFSNPGLDSYKQQFPFNILDTIRQKELDQILKKIEEYKPTKILVEMDRIKYDSLLQVSYTNYLLGKLNIQKEENEIYQLGFKLGKKIGHTRIYASDASAEWFGVNLDWDNYNAEKYLEERGQLQKSRRYDYNSFYRIQDSLKSTQTLIEHFIMINEPLNRLKAHQVYLTNTILNGAGESYLGADSVTRWYRRNLRIFANVLDITDFDQEERILLIYGSGHVWQLRQFFMDSPDFDYVEVNKFLQ